MKILFIGPAFNGYENTITRTLQKSAKYESVAYLPEYPFKSQTFFAITCTLFPHIKDFLINRHNNKIIANVKRYQFDTIFIIRGEYIKASTLHRIHMDSSNTKIIVYQWDSIKNNLNAKELIRNADSAFTFDYLDAKEMKISYLPLFSSWSEAGLTECNNVSIRYDILSIGGYRNHRMPYIDAIKRYCNNNGLRYRFHNFERFVSFLKNRKKLNMNFRDVNFSKISYKEYFNILQQSDIILDIPSPTQSGLTMRTMETLSMGKKLITTNKNIINEKFYNDNVFIINSPSDIGSEEFQNFIKRPAAASFGVLSLTEWLREMHII